MDYSNSNAAVAPVINCYQYFTAEDQTQYILLFFRIFAVGDFLLKNKIKNSTVNFKGCPIL